MLFRSIGGTASDIAIRAEVYAKWKLEMAQLTAEQTGQPLEKVTADADRDAWFTADEARTYGFIDHVVTRANQTPTA